jgi:hypothetical protein
MLVATMTQSAFTSLSAWTKHHSPDSSRSTRTQLTSGTGSRLNSAITSRVHGMLSYSHGPGNGEVGTRRDATQVHAMLL